MTTMIEKLARAISDVERKANGWPALRPDETLESAGTKWYTEMARACLTALLEPDAAMVDKGISALDDCVDHDWDSGHDGYGHNDYTTIRSDAASVTFKAMIRAALEEKA